jgi:hypothetical protein
LVEYFLRAGAARLRIRNAASVRPVGVLESLDATPRKGADFYRFVGRWIRFLNTITLRVVDF